MEYRLLSNEPYQSFRQSIRGFVSEKIKPHALVWEQQEFSPKHLLKEVGDLGYIGISLPKEVGGGGKDFWHEVVLAEELARCGTLGWALSFLVQGNMLAPLILQLGTEEQKENILKPALRGEFYLALGVTEANSGSDLISIKTEAKLKDNYYYLTGEKRYISNGSIAGYIVTLARTISKDDVWSLGFILVPSSADGLTREKLPTMGLKTGDTAAIIFKDCKIPKENILGETNKGFVYLLRGLQRERLICAVALNSLALYVLEQTIEFLKNRERFNEPLSKKQVIRHKLAELRSKVEAARQFTYAVCDEFAKDKPIDSEIIMLKIFSYETCQEVIQECVHLHGGEAFLKTYWLSHVYHDSQAFTLAAGTSEIMRDLLAGMMQL